MTYNIEVKDDDDGWEGRDPSKVVDTIMTFNPDVLGLQEDDGDWDSYLSALKGYSCYKSGGNGNENLAIYYKSDKFTLVTSGIGYYKKLAKEYKDVDAKGADLTLDTKGNFDISVFDKIGRFFRYVVLEDDKGVQYLVVNTHLHYGKGTGSNYPDDELLRDYQTRLLRRWLDNMSADYSNQIVMGDMNATPGKQTIAELTGNSGLLTSENSAIIKHDMGGTLITEHEKREEWIFDYILYTDENMQAVEYSVINNEYDDADYTPYPSDHLPVIAKLIYYR